MSSKTMFHCDQINRPNRRSTYAVMKIKSFSFFASIRKSFHKFQCRIIQFFSKLNAQKQHQCFMILKQEQESNINNLEPNNANPTFKREQQLHHQYLLPPLVSTKKRSIILDLDETLVHSTIDMPPLNYDFMIKPIINGVAMNFYVLKRPGVDEFLEAISKKYEIVVFTAGLEPYASLLLDVLDPKGLISHRLYRDSCKKLTRTRFVKDLSMIGRNLGNIVIVDDNPRSYSLQPANGIPIERFVNDVEDRELEKLLGFFQRDCDGFQDMRDAVKQYFCKT